MLAYLLNRSCEVVFRCVLYLQVCRRMLYSRSEILATEERSHVARVSYVVETSKQAARAAGGRRVCVHMCVVYACMVCVCARCVLVPILKKTF